MNSGPRAVIPGPFLVIPSAAQHRTVLGAARNLALVRSIFLLVSPAARAQVATGTYPFASTSGGPDIINNGNNNAHLDVLILSKAGRQLPLRYVLSYDSSAWSPVNSSGASTWTPVANWGWSASSTNSPSGYVSYGSIQAQESRLNR